MFCNQCEQAARGTGCDKVTVCGKPANVADLFDLILYQTKGLSYFVEQAHTKSLKTEKYDRFIIESLFLTVTNVNFDEARVRHWARRADRLLDEVARLTGIERTATGIPQAAQLSIKYLSDADLVKESQKYPITALSADADIQSLIQLLVYGVKGLAAYAEHAATLGKTNSTIFRYISSTLSAILNPEISADTLISLNMKCGEVNIACMKLLNDAHIEHFGVPTPTEVFTGRKPGPSIVVSGHDLYMLEQLLLQTDKEGVNVYTHGEMLPAHGYPKLKAHKSLVGHFGTAWQNQQVEFSNQPIAFIFNTNCIQRPAESYEDRVYTTSVVGWPGAQHIDGYDFSSVIEKAKSLGGFPVEKSGSNLMTGFGHDAVLGVADKIVAGVKSGAIKHFFLVGGCDGAKSGRNYYTDFVEQSPEDTVVLTLACGKFRFNHLQEKLGSIGGIPRLLDVGQCNDAYSAVVIATKLAEAFDCEINDLPLSLIISWYEQKAVVVLLSLLHLGIKGIRLGPTLPAFITPNNLDFLVETFDLKLIGNSARADLEEILH